MKWFSFLISSCLLFIACKKESNDAPIKSRTQLLTNKKWITTAISGKLSDGTVVADGFSTIPEYAKDNYYLFKSDLTFGIYANQLKGPNETSDILESGIWKLINSDTYLELTAGPQPPGQTVTYFPTKIIGITENTMKWEVYDDQGNTIFCSFKTIP